MYCIQTSILYFYSDASSPDPYTNIKPVQFKKTWKDSIDLAFKIMRVKPETEIKNYENENEIRSCSGKYWPSVAIEYWYANNSCIFEHKTIADNEHQTEVTIVRIEKIDPENLFK